MRTLPLFLLACLLLAPGALRAQDPAPNPDAPTANLPKRADLCVRLPALDRIDGLVKDMSLVIELFAGKEANAFLAQGAPSEMLLGMLGIDGTLVDRTKPVYVGTMGNDPMLVLPAAEGAKLEGPLPLGEGHHLTQKDGLLIATRPDVLGAEARTGAVEMLPGDFSIHVFVGDLTERHRDAIEAGFAQAGGMMGMMPVPGGAAMGGALMEAVKGGLYSIESLDYSLTWQGEGAMAEGRILMKPDSPLKKLLSRAGAPAEVGLAAFLPKDALFFADSATTPDWPAKEMTEFANKHLGGQIAAMLQQGMALGQAIQGSLTGRQASSMGMTGFMGFNSVNVSELKEGVDGATLLADFDVGPMNESLKGAGLPMAFKLEKDVAKHGETSMHRWTFQSDDPQLGMMAMMMQTYIASEGKWFCVVSSQTGETDMRELLDRIRAGGDTDHPHLKAMAGLGRGRNVGITFNVGQVKQMAMMFQMFAPEAAQAVAALPDVLTMSTSITMDGGDIHWRGNWPLKEIGKVVEKIRSSMAEKKEGEAEEKPEPQEEEDFK